MDQRTCNIIMCCKGNSSIDPGEHGLTDKSTMHQAVAAYMSRECAYPMEDYDEYLLEQILQEAMFDYMNSADRPGSDLRGLFTRTVTEDKPMNERIMTMFSLVKVRGDKGYVNGFTEKLINKSRKDLGREGDPVYHRKEDNEE